MRAVVVLGEGGSPRCRVRTRFILIHACALFFIAYKVPGKGAFPGAGCGPAPFIVHHVCALFLFPPEGAGSGRSPWRRVRAGFMIQASLSLSLTQTEYPFEHDLNAIIH